VSQVNDELLKKLAALQAVGGVSLVPREPAATAQRPEPATAAGSSAGEMVKVVAKQSQQALLDVINLITESGLSITSLEILQPNRRASFCT